MSEQLTFLPDQNQINISIQIINDLLTEGSESFIVRISEVHNETMFVTTPSSATIIILDDESKIFLDWWLDAKAYSSALLKVFPLCTMRCISIVFRGCAQILTSTHSTVIA